MKVISYYFKVFPRGANSRLLRVVPIKRTAEVQISLMCGYCRHCRGRIHHVEAQGYVVRGDGYGGWVEVPYIEPVMVRHSQLPQDLFVDSWHDCKPVYMGKNVHYEGEIEDYTLYSLKRILGLKAEGWFPAKTE